MRICLQRVSKASVSVVGGEGPGGEVARIGPGAAVLAGFRRGDGEPELSWVAAKIADLRIFPAEGSGFDQSLRQTGGELLVVSQFTLYGDPTKGRRPDFGEAAPYEEAEQLFDRFVELCEEELPGRVAAGRFGALMNVELTNNGPVTIWIEH